MDGGEQQECFAPSDGNRLSGGGSGAVSEVSYTRIVDGALVRSGHCLILEHHHLIILTYKTE